MSTVLVTGANRGIGLELTKRYAAGGHHVLACCRAPEKAADLAAVAREHAAVRPLGVEVSKGGSVDALASEIGDEPIDVLINNAGMAGPPPQHQSLADMDYEGWAETFAVNTMAPLRVLQAFRKNLAAGTSPKAITITSQMGALGLDMVAMYAYCTSKAAVNKLMRLASFELKKEGIAVALIHPGWVRTGMGGAQAQLSPEESAAGIVSVIEQLTLDETGCFKTWNGETHVW